ncbi:MAG: D-aminoacyl-tRNA deacylase [Spirochaetota bacterium]
MRAVVQRAADCRIEVDGARTAELEQGVLVYLGVTAEDDDTAVRYVSEKVANLRIFEDEDGKMNRSVLDTGGGVCVVSQFTLYGDTRKGRRPSYNRAAPPDIAVPLYESFVAALESLGLHVETGTFGAVMQVSYTNPGPVTILIDSEKTF